MPHQLKASMYLINQQFLWVQLKEKISVSMTRIIRFVFDFEVKSYCNSEKREVEANHTNC